MSEQPQEAESAGAPGAPGNVSSTNLKPIPFYSNSPYRGAVEALQQIVNEEDKTPSSSRARHYQRYYAANPNSKLKYFTTFNAPIAYDVICDPIGFRQHSGECWSDSIQQILLFCDTIKETSQPFFLNNSEAEFTSILEKYEHIKNSKETLLKAVHLLMLIKKRFINKYNSLKEFTNNNKGVMCLLDDYPDPVKRYDVFQKFFKPEKQTLKRQKSEFLGMVSANLMKNTLTENKNEKPKTNLIIEAGASKTIIVKAITELLKIIGLNHTIIESQVISSATKKMLHNLNTQNNSSNVESINDNLESAYKELEAEVAAQDAAEAAAANSSASSTKSENSSKSTIVAENNSVSAAASENNSASAAASEISLVSIIKSMYSDVHPVPPTIVATLVSGAFASSLFLLKTAENEYRFIKNIKEEPFEKTPEMRERIIELKKDNIVTLKNNTLRILDYKLDFGGHATCFYKCDGNLLYYDDNFGLFKTPAGLNIDDINGVFYYKGGEIAFVNFDFKRTENVFKNGLIFHEGEMLPFNDARVKKLIDGIIVGCMHFLYYIHVVPPTQNAGKHKRKRQTIKKRNKRMRTRTRSRARKI